MITEREHDEDKATARELVGRWEAVAKQHAMWLPWRVDRPGEMAVSRQIVIDLVTVTLGVLRERDASERDDATYQGILRGTKVKP